MKLPLAKIDAQVPQIVDDPVRAVAELSEKALVLERILAEVATPEQVKKWLLDICEAESVRPDKFGGEFRAPDWDARIKGVDRVMSILKYTSKEPRVLMNQAPTKIVIQVIDNKPAA